MKLDPRIIEGKKPLTCFDAEDAKQFIGKECYFCDCPLAFGDLDKFTTLVRNNLFRVQDTEKPFLTDTIASFRYAYCLPCEWVKEEKKEPQYRAFTFDEFLDKFQVGQVIRYRLKSQPHIDILETLSVLRINHPYMEVSVRLSVGNYEPQGLFEEFEIFEPEDPLNPTAKDWKPFGTKDTEE